MKNKRIDHINKIMSKNHVFLPKTLTSFFKMQEKLEMCWNSNLTNSRRPFSGEDTNVTFIS